MKAHTLLNLARRIRTAPQTYLELALITLPQVQVLQVADLGVLK